MIENLKELVNDEKQMINKENKTAELKMGNLTINVGVIEGSNLENILDDKLVR